MEYSFIPFSKFIASSFWALVMVWIANIAVKAWKACRTFVILKKNGMVY